MGLKREGEASFPFLCFWFLLSHHKRNMLFSFPWKRNAPPSSWRRCRFVPASRSRGTMVLFSKARMVLCVAKYTYQKRFFADRTAILGGKAGSPALRLRSSRTDFPSFLGLLDYDAIAKSAMSYCDYPPYVKASSDFLCLCLRQTIALCFPSILQLLET